MERKSVAMMVVFAFMVLVLLSTPLSLRGHVSTATPAPSAVVGSVHVTAAAHSAPATPHPMTTYPRTVLVETFTAQWCVYCEMESQAWYSLQHRYPTSVLAVGELHVCYSQSSCGDNYPTTDGTANTRSSFYGVSAFPDVFFDGAHQILGAANTEAELETAYEGMVLGAAAVPGNVSIVQTAAVLAGNTVSSRADITSAISGPYHAITYLVEYIGKNDSSGHDIDNVIRAGLVDTTVTLSAGATTTLIGSRVAEAGWNVQHMSVITLVQQNSTKIIENANFAPVHTLMTGLTSNVTAVSAGMEARITLHATNSSTGTGVAGANVVLTTSNGGTLIPASGVTASDGSFTATFTGPTVASPVSTLISAQVNAPGYTPGLASIVLTLNPLVLSTAATGLSVAAGYQHVLLNWTTPAAGGAGVTYFVYRSTDQTGPWTVAGVSPSLNYVDGDVAVGQSYWYKVSAHSGIVSSANTTAVAAAALTAVSQGLPPNTGWWLSIDSVTFSSSTNASLSIFLPVGYFDYSFGPDSYAYLAPEGSGLLTVTAAPVELTASFVPRYATLEGTVSPATATVTVDGTALSVVGGSFSQLLESGTYAIEVTASGYQTNTTSVTLTPGNLTAVSLSLDVVPAQSGAGTDASQWPSGNWMVAIVGLAVIAVAGALGGMMVLSRRRKGSPPPRAARKTPGRSPPREP